MKAPLIRAVEQVKHRLFVHSEKVFRKGLGTNLASKQKEKASRTLEKEAAVEERYKKY